MLVHLGKSTNLEPDIFRKIVALGRLYPGKTHTISVTQSIDEDFGIARHAGLHIELLRQRPFQIISEVCRVAAGQEV